MEEHFDHMLSTFKHCRPEHLAAYRTNIQEYQAAGAAPNSDM